MPLQLASIRGPIRVGAAMTGAGSRGAAVAAGAPSVTLGATGVSAGAAAAVIDAGRASSTGRAAATGCTGAVAAGCGGSDFGAGFGGVFATGLGSGGLTGGRGWTGSASGGLISATSSGFECWWAIGDPASAMAIPMMSPWSARVAPAAATLPGITPDFIARIIVTPMKPSAASALTDETPAPWHRARAALERGSAVPARRRALVGLAVGAASVASGGCAPLTRSIEPLPAGLERLVANPPGIDFLLLGEVHDNPDHHRRRLAWLRRLAAAGRFALALEQLDTDRQSAIDTSLRRGDDARTLAESAGFDFQGWDWPSYRPFVELAIERRLPLIAANLSNARTRRIARAPIEAADGLPDPIARPPAGWSGTDQSTIEREIADGHCGMLPARAVAPMALAQRARDATMADAMLSAHRATGLPVVLIAGNGHVRRDVGVPRHLASRMPGARILSIGVLENAERRSGSVDVAEPAPGAAYDLIVETDPHPRNDPCEVFRSMPRPGAAPSARRAGG